MSFSSDAKAELCRVPLTRRCCARAEAYGVLLYAGSFSPTEVRIVTESEDFAARLPKLFQKAFSVRFDAQESGSKSIFRITDGQKLAVILEALGYDPDQHYALHVNFALLEEECCRASFLRGAFLAGGSVTDPLKRYHLELATPHLQAGREVEALLRDMGYEPKNVQRQGNGVTYFKQSDHIEELLTRIGAPAAAMEVMAAKVEKEMRNTVNRRVNCDAANVDKAVAASREQVEALTRGRRRHAAGQAAGGRGRSAFAAGAVAQRAGRDLRPAADKILPQPPDAQAHGACGQRESIKRGKHHAVCTSARSYGIQPS